MASSLESATQPPLIPVQRNSERPVGAPRHAACPSGPLSLLAQARSCCELAQDAETAEQRYVEAHIAAFRAATALVLARSRYRTSAKPASVWSLLTEAVPELREWAGYFAARSERRAAVEAGARISGEEAEELQLRSGEFLAVAERSLLEVLS
ncbi:SAV_6107 family HEPN domain-containing protein [Salinifilum ghardaiensis]